MWLFETEDAKTGSPGILRHGNRCGKALKLRQVVLFGSGLNVRATDSDHTLVKLRITSCASGVT